MNKTYSNLKIFAQFYALSTGYVEGTIPPVFKEENKMLIPVCGSDGTLLLDGRKCITTLMSIASKTCKERNFLGYVINKGTFDNPRQLTMLQTV